MILKKKIILNFYLIRNFQAFELKKTDILKCLSKKTDILKFLSKKTGKNWDFSSFSKKTDLAWFGLMSTNPVWCKRQLHCGSSTQKYDAVWDVFQSWTTPSPHPIFTIDGGLGIRRFLDLVNKCRFTRWWRLQGM